MNQLKRENLEWLKKEVDILKRDNLRIIEDARKRDFWFDDNSLVDGLEKRYRELRNRLGFEKRSA
jgi:hypothetical protein